ncbi:MAG: chloride channel protein [Gemmatimonadota bacterium]|nr:chloride channel protein [Gemmatimonadota bacterium]
MNLSRLRVFRLWRVMARRFRQRLHANIERMRTTDQVFMISAAVLIGVLGAGGAIAFRELIMFIESVAWGGGLSDRVSLTTLAVLTVPTAGGLIVGVLIYFSTREARGLPDVMEAVALRGGRIRPRVAVETSLATAISIGTGLSVGREGPIAQIGAAIGSTFGRLTHVNVHRMRTFVGCGAAAGIAATFNTPIAGALFALEVILGNFSFSRFSPIVISSVVATAISRHFLGNQPAIIVPPHGVNHPLEFALYAVLGILAAIVGTLFVRALYGVEDLYGKVPLPDYLKPMTGGLLVGALALLYPQILGVGYETMDRALFSELEWQFLLILVFMKIAATSFSLGSGASGGVIAPSLFVGCMLGGAFGALVNHLLPGTSATDGAYALVAMGALVSSTIRTPMTSILMIFEMTGNYELILPLAISVIVSTALSAYLLKPSVYTLRLLRRNVDLEKGQETNILRSLTVGQARVASFETIPPQAPLDDLMSRLADSTDTEFYITDGEERYQGTVTFDRIRSLVAYGEDLEGVIVAHDIAQFDLPTVNDGDTLDRVMLLFGRHQVNAFPVVEPDSGRLVGVISREHVMDAYNRETARRDLAGEFGSMVDTLSGGQVVQLGDAYAMVEINAPRRFIGSSIRRLQIRSRHGVQILLIRKREHGDGQDAQSKPADQAVQAGQANRDGQAHFVPAPDYVIQEEDVLLVAGERDRIDRIIHL